MSFSRLWPSKDQNSMFRQRVDLTSILRPFNLQKFNNNMKVELILLTTIITVCTEAIEASAKLIKYDPFIFQLQFSEKVALPKFQLFLNNFDELKYTLLTKQPQSLIFHFQIEPFQLPQAKELQKYCVIFNNPLEIGDGRLDNKYFSLDVEKQAIEVHFPQAWAILLLVLAYLAINFAANASVLIEFLQIYCLINYRGNISTDLHMTMSKGLMLLNSQDINLEQNLASLYVCLCGPAFLILSFGAIGFLIKKFFGKKDKNTAYKFVYEVVVYDLFVCVSLTFIFPLAFNSIQFLSLLAEGIIEEKTLLANFGSFISYIALVTLVSVVYLFAYVLNPKLKQEALSWKAYQASEEYLNFRRLHQILIQDRWYTRNQNVFSIIKKILIALCFFIKPGFEVTVLLLQFIHIIYISMVQPYRQGFYMNFSISCRIIMFFFYGAVIIADLYYSIGHAMVNYKSVKNFLIDRDILFLFICFAIIVSVAYEIYLKYTNFNYRIRLVQEENQYRLKITERRTQKEENVGRRKRTTQLTSFHYENEPQIRSESNSIDKQSKKSEAGITITRENTLVGNESPSLSNHRQMKNGSYSPRSQSITSRPKRSESKPMWQKQSLLADIISDK